MTQMRRVRVVCGRWAPAPSLAAGRGIVGQFAGSSVLCIFLEKGSPDCFVDPEDGFGEGLVRVLGQQRCLRGLTGIGDMFQEDETQGDVFIMGSGETYCMPLRCVR